MESILKVGILWIAIIIALTLGVAVTFFLLWLQRNAPTHFKPGRAPSCVLPRRRFRAPAAALEIGSFFLLVAATLGFAVDVAANVRNLGERPAFVKYSTPSSHLYY